MKLPDLTGATQVSFIRSAGPGGQNVNKLATAAQLRFRIADCPGLDAAAAGRLRALAGRRLTDRDEIIIMARNHRTQEGNRRDAWDRLTALIETAMKAPVPRRATKPTRASRERRLSVKVRAGQTKKLRGRVRGDD
ncbi:MAG TPA: alternative ribosome rescue aminoacyl-tRNA hydrolase ArfB [Steroidobacteraceae bacterium]|nr:alternative ribosome rescue aminoacyl-tRNA hydrolase ArfB [Steroidobacteraceae bacterium]